MEAQVALVTGASSGIGAAIATTLGQAGFLVLLGERFERQLIDVTNINCVNSG